MDTLAILGIALAIITIIILSVRGLNIVIAAPLATLIVILTNDMPIFELYRTTKNPICQVWLVS